jgi:plastocyanin
MGGHPVRGTVVVVLVVLAGVGVLMSPAVASGGGGCGRAVTDRSGVRVRILDYCFGPTILRVRPGQTVTWSNQDSFRHTVLGANGAWGGFDVLRRDGGEANYRFVDSGVYPYVCTYHPGMIGAIVVGNGRGRGLAGAVTTSSGPVVPEFSTPMAEPVAAAEPSQGASWPAIAWWGMGLLVVSGAALVVGRRRAATV